MKSGPGKCRRSFEILGDLNPNNDSAFAPRYVSILLPDASVAMTVPLFVFSEDIRATSPNLSSDRRSRLAITSWRLQPHEPPTPILESPRKAYPRQAHRPAIKVCRLSAGTIAMAIAPARTVLPGPLLAPAPYRFS